MRSHKIPNANEITQKVMQRAKSRLKEARSKLQASRAHLKPLQESDTFTLIPRVEKFGEPVIKLGNQVIRQGNQTIKQGSLIIKFW